MDPLEVGDGGVSEFGYRRQLVCHLDPFQMGPYSHSQIQLPPLSFPNYQNLPPKNMALFSHL